LDKEIQGLIKRLGDAINETVANSEQIAEVIQQIKLQGYDVFLVLEASVGVNKREAQGEAEPEREPAAVGVTRNPELVINAQDVRFLKSLRISLDEAA